MPIASNTSYTADRDSIIADVTKGDGTAVPTADQITLYITSNITDEDLFAQQSLFGLATEVLDYLFSEWESIITNGGGAGNAVTLSIAADGKVTEDKTGIFGITVGANLNDARASHSVEAAFKVATAAMLEDGKTGYTPVPVGP